MPERMSPGGAECPGREPRRTVEKTIRLLGRGSRERRRQQLRDHTEGIVALEQGPVRGSQGPKDFGEVFGCGRIWSHQCAL
jgi:hypothetical protein